MAFLLQIWSILKDIQTLIVEKIIEGVKTSVVKGAITYFFQIYFVKELWAVENQVMKYFGSDLIQSLIFLDFLRL